MDTKTEEAYRLSFQQIQSHDVLAACRTVANYELSQPRPRGLFSGISAQEYWESYPCNEDAEILKSILLDSPEILNGISGGDMEMARIMAAFNFIWGLSHFPKWLHRHEFSSTSLDDSAVPAMLLFHAQSRQELKEYEEVELSCCPDSCEFCKSEDGKIYKSSDAPVLPHAHCTHEQGCRCCYLPVI